MINNEKQYRHNESPRYRDDYVEYDPRMTASRNAYAEENYSATDRRDYKNETADFEEMLDGSQNFRQEDDLLPSKTTMQFVGKDRNYIYEDLNEYDDELENDENTSYKINTKGKIMIAVYALVVLTIFTLIIMNTRLIRNVNTSIAESEERIAVLEEKSVALNDHLNEIKSDEYIADWAIKNGMSNSSYNIG